MTTKSIRSEKKWFIFDAKDKILGRSADRVAAVLRGKHKVTFTPHLDCGDGVIVINAAQIRLTGTKWAKKLYRHHSGYLGGLKTQTATEVHAKDATEIFRHAVHGMLPKNRLRKHMMMRLHIYADDRHPHEAQKPTPLLIINN